ncbi:MAG: C69 family dipeptidase [Microscillaceae bacterium]|jgi:dipeptidase|nr:C69 family dipeptidase [Microscillaceae bacterium]
MCDTFVALPSHTATGNLIFGKNSDREPNEAQAIVRIPAQILDNKQVRCTYINIPQVESTYEIIVSKPFQMWGAEMGINEKGLVIGNEAVFTKVKFNKKNEGLTGMDLLRLALERADSAERAIELITNLLAEYGQDACGGYENRNFYYHNSFIIADKQTAWVLETAGKEWAAQQVKGFRSISNGLTIENDYDLISPQAINWAKKQGWLKTGEDFSFRKAYSDSLMTYMSSCKIRQQHTQNTLQSHNQQLNVQAAIKILQSHNLPAQAFRPAQASSASVCMHATGLLNPSQTTGSMIVENRIDQPATVWLTGTSMPCLSVFKPFFLGGKSILLDQFLAPGVQADDSLWWQAEKLHRLICQDYQKYKSLIINELNDLQTHIFQQATALINQNAELEKLDLLSEESLMAHFESLKIWFKTLHSTPPPKKSWNPFYQRWLKYYDQKAKIWEE